MKDIIIVGAGGFGREMLQIIKDINSVKPTWHVKGFISDDLNSLDGKECDCKIIGTVVDWIPGKDEVFALAIGSPCGKEKVTNNLVKKGAEFVDIIHPTAFISSFCKTGKGLVMYPGTRLSPNVTIGNYVTLLSGAGHDASIGDFSTVSSYCDITGCVSIGNRVFLGSHVTIIPKRKIGDDAYLAAGSVVMTNVKAGSKVMGNPAKRYEF